MAKIKSNGYTDTAINGVTELTFERGLLNFAADFRKKSEQSGKEIVLTNITSPVDRPERIRIAYSDIANIYSGTEIEPSVAAPTKRGVSILVQNTNVISVTDSSDPDYRVDLPVSYHLVIEVPVNENLVSSDLMTGLGRLISALFETGSEANTRLDALLRGSLSPSDI